MSNAIIVSFLVSLVGGNEISGDLCGYRIAGVANFLETLTSQQGGEIILATPELISIKEEARQRVWSIGKLANSTPVIICREVVKAGEKFRIDVHALCGGSPDECAAYIQHFRS